MNFSHKKYFHFITKYFEMFLNFPKEHFERHRYLVVEAILVPKLQQPLELPEDGVDDLPLPPGLGVVLEVGEEAAHRHQHRLGLAVRAGHRQGARQAAAGGRGDRLPRHQARVLEYLTEHLRKNIWNIAKNISVKIIGDFRMSKKIFVPD